MMGDVYGRWRMVHTAADAVHVAVNEPEPELITGYWSDTSKKKIVTKNSANHLKAGDTVVVYVGMIGIPDDTYVTITFKEWDPTIFDGDETLFSVGAKVANGCIRHKVVLDDNWYVDERDRISEVYFEVDAKFNHNGKSYSLSESYPESTDDYLYVADKGIPITVIIKLPHSESTDKAESKGLGGHTGIAIGQEFYDFGPDIDQYDDDHGPISGVPGIPWWDQQILEHSNGTLTRLSDVDLPHIIKHIKDDVEQDTFTIEFTVTTEQAKNIEKWWLERYKNLGTYACLPWKGEQCTTTVRSSLELAGVIPGSAVQTPKAFLDHLKIYAVNTAGDNQGKRATFTQIQWEK